MTRDEKVKMIIKLNASESPLLNNLEDFEYIAAAVLHRERLLRDLFRIRKVSTLFAAFAKS